MGVLVTLLINSIAVYVTASILPGVRIQSFMTAMVVSIVLGMINSFIKPIVFLLTLPINFLTIGLFTFVIIGFLTMLVTYIVPGFEIRNFWWAILFALVLSICNSFLSSFLVKP